MRKTAIKILVMGAALALVLFVVFMINQTASLVALGDRIHPLAGDIVLWVLIAFYTLCVIVPVYLFITLPAPLVPPRSEISPEFPRYLQEMAKRLGRNPHIGRTVAASKEDVENALRELERRADDAMKKAAGRIFLATAISQNGKLDGLIVLAAQSRLVLDIARVYYQRPTIRNLIFLYANVAAMVFIAGELEDMDLAAIVQPVLTGILGSAAGAIPGFQVASMMLVSSVISGSSNAFLTLRVGAITKQYCGSLVMPTKRTVRRQATLEATRMLGSIVAEGTKKVYDAIWTSSKSRLGTAIDDIGAYAKRIWMKLGGEGPKSAEP
ncbi:MAG TPA: DUF697 domain-containing protein [Syntrophorhabdaceae bacterium]|nr:DUF697 domain-containing protein [Syntrophorhabdaceae bacterium]